MSFMKALVLYGDDDVRFESVPMPEVLAGMVRIKVKATGICGSDIPRVFAGGAYYYPIILGHEFSGIVEEVGDGVTTIKKGERVAGVPLVPCMKCDDCYKGHYASCKNYGFIGSKRQGSMAEYVVIPEMCVIPLPESVTFEQAAMFEPSTVGLHGVLQAGFQGGNDVAILGGGTIGLFTLQWLRIFGAKSITVFDKNKQRLKFLKSFGADNLIDICESGFYEPAMKLTSGKGFPFVFESAGQPETLQGAIAIAAVKANVCLIGTPHVALQFEPMLWEKLNRKEMHLIGSWMSYSAPFPGKEWNLTAHYLKKGQLIIDDSMIYKKYSLQNGKEALNNFKTGHIQGKIMLTNEG